MTSDLVSPHPADCLSCGTAVHGKFCSNCAEALHPHPPSVGEFLHEFVSHYVALEGKLGRTLALLLRRPGQLTVEFLRGRRVPFVEPLRLYLTFSLIFFALIKVCGVALPQIKLGGSVDKGQIVLGVKWKVALPAVATLHEGKQHLSTEYEFLINVKGDDAAEEAQIQDILGSPARFRPAWADNLKHFDSLPDDVKSKRLNQGITTNLPYMLILSMPLLALYLKLAYLRSGRRYAEHLVFALHANAFAFLLAGGMLLMPGSLMAPVLTAGTEYFQLVPWWHYLQFIPLLGLLAYLPLAMQRVYGGRIALTIVRWLAVLLSHLTIVALLTVAAELVAILGGG